MLFCFDVYLLLSHSFIVDYLSIEDKLATDCIYMTIEHGIVNGKKIDDQSLRWILFLFWEIKLKGKAKFNLFRYSNY